MPEAPSPGAHGDSGLFWCGFLATGATLLASFGVTTLLPGAAQADPAHGNPTTPTDLAVGRPVTASSTDYAPTPPEFAVDGLNAVGVAGSGWRAGPGDPQWITVDPQAPRRISSVVLTFEAKPGDPAFDPTQSRSNTIGTEIQSSYAVAFSLDVSGDGENWSTVYQTASGTGAVTTIPLTNPVTARWVR